MATTKRAGVSNFLCGGLVLMAGGWGGLAVAGEGKPATPAASAPAPKPIVEVQAVASRQVRVTSKFVGTLQCPKVVTLQPQVQGYLEKANFEEGSLAKEGDTLFEVDSRSYKASLAKALADVQSASASVLRNQQDVDRYVPLVKTNAVSQQDLDHARASLLSAQASLAAARAAVESCQLNLDWCRIQAPFSGLMGKRLVDVGNLVSPTLTPKLATLYQMDPIRAEFSISELQYLQKLDQLSDNKVELDTDWIKRNVGQAKFQLILSDKRLYPLEGKFTYIDPTVDPTTGTVACRAEFPNPDYLLRPGQFVTVQITGNREQAVIPVPKRAVFELQSLKQVYVVGADGKAELRTITLGNELNAGEVAADSGLKDGDRVVVEGWMKLRPGMSVESRDWKPN